MKKSLALVLSLLLILGVFPVMALASATLQGSGTSDEPYQIGDYAQLKEFADLVNGGQTGAYAVLTNDITATGTWTPICPDNEAAYKGVFDGQGHTITGLTVETGNAFTGLFGCVKGVVQNLTLKDSTIQGEGCVGAIAGEVIYCGVHNCHNVGTSVTGSSAYDGGIVGLNNGYVSDCTNSGGVTGESFVGGIAGSASGVVAYCFSAGRVTFQGLLGNPIVGRRLSGIGTPIDCTFEYNGFDWQVQGTSAPSGTPEASDPAVPRSTAQMTGLNATAYQDWEGFDTYWVKTASFPRLKAFLVTVSATAQTGGSVSGAGSYDKDDTVTLMATPNTGYHFVCWQEDGDTVSADANYSFTATIDRTLTAVFQINTYEITFKNGDEVLQTVEIAYGETPVYSGPTPTKEADAQYTYTFAGWDTALSAVTGETTYTAAFTATASPKTGDHRQPGLWLALLALSGFALAGSILVSRKRRRA